MPEIKIFNGTERCTMYMDAKELFDVPVCEGLLLVFFSFFCFNLEYDDQRNKVFVFIENYLLNWSFTKKDDDVQEMAEKLYLL